MKRDETKGCKGRTHPYELREGGGRVGLGGRGATGGAVVVQHQVLLGADDAHARVHIDLPRPQALAPHAYYLYRVLLQYEEGQEDVCWHKS